MSTPSTQIPAALNLFYTDHHSFPLPDGHKFPLEKYRLLRQALSGDPRFAFHAAPLIAESQILLVHHPEYVTGFLNGTLERHIMRRIGFPWSPELVSRTLASAGATLAATRTALNTGFGGTLAGGTHHAFHAEGSGFCVFNDLAIAIQWARANTALTRFAVVDCDVHQGDGTALLFQDDPQVFTLSLHAARNFPLRKQKSTLDIELPDATNDWDYLAALAPALEQVWEFMPQMVFFQSGVDALESDRLGHLHLTTAGLLERDNLVIGQTYARKVPLVITLGGGYSNPITHTVLAHAQTFKTAARILLA